MSDKRKQEVIKLLTNTIEIERLKGNLCNHEIVEKLSNKIESILAGKNKGIKSR